MTVEILENLMVICVTEPRGDNGLEGYQRGEEYRAQLCQHNSGGPLARGGKYYRVYPETASRYYETCSVAAFNRFFKLKP